MRIKFIPFFSITCLLAVSPAFTSAEEKTYTFGGKAGWPNSAQKQYIREQHGFNNAESLVLTPRGLESQQDFLYTDDLIITFDGTTAEDSVHHYVIERNDLITAPETAVHRGTGTGLSIGNGKGLSVRGNKESFFGSAGTKGSFTIDFWLYPFIAENGEQILSWRTSRINRQERTKMISQYINATVFRNRIEWNFENVFFDENGAPAKITLTAYDILIPEKWAHHQISYNETHNLLEYKIDGREEAVTYTTGTNTEYGKPHTLILGTPSTLELCNAYSGMIDDFRIRTGCFEPAALTRFNESGGRVELQPIDTGYRGSECLAFNAVSFIPEETDISYYIRSGDNFYTWEHEPPEWIPVVPGETLTGITGRYFQCAAELYTNGTADKTPQLNEMSLTCRINDPPWPPATVYAEAGDGSATLTWSASGSENIQGYMIFYGEKPGEYFGSSAAQGASPLKAGLQQSYTVTGLQNGKIYYFAIAAYTIEEYLDQGLLSKEVYVRPKRK